MTENGTAASWIVFDRIEIDLAGRRLFVAGAEAPLEPKAFAVLAHLARHPGHAFTRDEILDAVWGHRHITPGVLNRVITLLRHALGESAERTLYLHTLHGVGYRFDAPVQYMSSRPERSAGDKHGVFETVAAASGANSTIRSEVADRLLPTPSVDASMHTETAEGHAASAASVTATLGDEASNAISHQRARWHQFALVAAACLCVLIGAGVFLARRATQTPANMSPTLVVLPLHPVGAAHDESVLAEGLSEELITRLARIDGLRLISQTSAARAQADKLDLNQLAERLHVTHVLEGSLRQAGQQLRIDLRLIEIPAGRTLWAQDYDRGLVDVFAIQSEIAQSVASTLTLKLGLQSIPAERDPQLFREYLEIRRLLDWLEPDEYAKTTGLSRALVARAPDYARAHGLLARALLQELRPSLATAADNAEAAREATRALELDPDQIEAHEALATLACRATDWARCMNGFRRVLTLAPADSVVRTTYGRWLAATGYLDEGLRQTEIAAVSDPLNYSAIFFRARVLDTLGRHDVAQQDLEAAVRYAPSKAGRLSYARWFNAIWRRDYGVARECAAAMPVEENFRDAYVAATEALLNPTRWPQVETLIQASERATGHYNFVRMLQPHPDAAKAMAGLEEALLTGSSSYNLLLWNPETVALRRDPAFQDFLSRTHLIDYWRRSSWPPLCRPNGDGAQCD